MANPQVIQNGDIDVCTIILEEHSWDNLFMLYLS